MPEQSTDTPKLAAGIDPGAETGFALYCAADAQLTEVTSGHFLEIATRLRHLAERGCLGLVLVEDTRQLPIYARHRKKGMALQAKMKMARNIGGIDRDCQLWEDFLRALGVPFRMVPRGKSAKWDADTLEQITGYSARSNEHGRDAAKLCWKQRIPATNTD